MSSELNTPTPTTPDALSNPRTSRSQSVWMRILKPFASLKLTVGLLVLGLLMTWVASLQQTRMDIWEVKNQHFNSPISFVPPLFVYVPLETFCVPAWTPHSVTRFFSREIYGGKIGIPLPSGGLIMILMLFNLAAAHTVRFRVKAKGGQLWTGIIVFALGSLLTGMVVLNGQNSKGFQAEPMFSWWQLWIVIQIGLAAAFVSSILGAFHLPKERRMEKGLLASLAFLLAALLIFLLVKGESAFIGDSAMRILWQLIQGGVGSLVMLVGCHYIFERKSGIVLLHLGLVLMMLGEFYVTYSAVEQRMTFAEGETISHTIDIRDFELAIMTSNDNGTENVVSVPSDLLKPQGWLSRLISRNPEIINDERLPFKIRPVKYYRNSTLEDIIGTYPGNIANAGNGLRGIAHESAINTGTSSEQKVDFATVYAELINKSNNESLGVYMLSQRAYLNDKVTLDELTINGKTYRFGLRFRHEYKPYSIKLVDVKRENYPGTQTPKSFESTLQVDYPKLGLDVEKKVWMNNPLRFGNETFYQQSHEDKQGEKEISVIQIVQNTGWMIPYVCCMMVAIGLLAQFGQTLIKYLRENPDEARSHVRTGLAAVFGFWISGGGKPGVQGIPPTRSSKRSRRGNEMLETQPAKRSLSSWITLGFIVFLTLFFAYWFYAMSKPRTIEKEELRLDLLGEVPIVYGGRIQPMDSLARNVIRKLTKSGSVKKAVSLQTIVDELEVTEEQALKIIEPLLDRKLIAPISTYEDDRTEADKSEGDEEFKPFLMYSGNHNNLTTKKAPEVDAKHLETLTKLFEEASESQKPIRWMADLLFTNNDFDDYFIFKIEHPEVQQALRLPRRHGSRYSFGEVTASLDQINANYGPASEQRASNPDALTNFQKQILELGDTITMFRQFILAFHNPLLDKGLPPYEAMALAEQVEGFTLPMLAGPDSSPEIWQAYTGSEATNELWKVANREGISKVSELAAFLAKVYVNDRKRPELIRQMAARFAPEFREKFPELDDGELRQWIEARLNDTSADENSALGDMRKQVDGMIDSLLAVEREKIQPAFEASLRNVLRIHVDDDPLTNDNDLNRGIPFKSEIGKLKDLESAYKTNDSKTFNTGLREYLKIVHDDPPKNYSVGRLKAESWLNRTNPFFIAWFAYLCAAVLSLIGWLGWRKQIGKIAFTLIVIAMFIHGLGLISRCYITYRPPVTNLYSSALLVGWAAAFFYLIIEKILRIGIGNLMAGTIGFTTLLIAMNLSNDALDTMAVMVAVLDTQFWLSTHVVIISLGYSSTYVAGFLGLAYILGSMFAPGFDKDVRRKVSRMVYGVTCFSLIFSFVGTVLGGLWADDSWGRFWGWDVKENGALMIVLVNAILLHARWAGIVRERGMALIAILGNIVVTWSWFAVNELGVGLHAYAGVEGDTSTIQFWQTTQFWLFLFWGSQLFVIAMGLLWPKKLWLSSRSGQA